MNMRGQLVATAESFLERDSRACVLLGDIGVYGFRKAMEVYPDRVLNIGILEQATVGVAAGLAKTGLIPVVHTIAPFLAERALEQIKIDFGYQKLEGHFVTVGGSYDYAALGCTHHCPGDVEVMRSIPGMHIHVPGTAEEFDRLFKQSFGSSVAHYHRLSERSNSTSRVVERDKAMVVKKGSKATVVVVGPMLDTVLEAAGGLDVSVLYYTTVTPFDVQTLRENSDSSRIVVVEPFYEGTLSADISKAMGARPHTIRSIGVPRKFLSHYGKAQEIDEVLGLTSSHIRSQILLESSHERSTSMEIYQ